MSPSNNGKPISLLQEFFTGQVSDVTGLCSQES